MNISIDPSLFFFCFFLPELLMLESREKRERNFSREIESTARFSSDGGYDPAC
jgi:hypothetical protein